MADNQSEQMAGLRWNMEMLQIAEAAMKVRLKKAESTKSPLNRPWSSEGVGNRQKSLPIDRIKIYDRRTITTS